MQSSRNPTAGQANKVYYICSFGGCGSTMLTRFFRPLGTAYHIHSRTPPSYLTTIKETDHPPHGKEWFSDERIIDPSNYNVVFLYRHPTYAQLAGTGVTGRPVYNKLHHKNIQVGNRQQLPANINLYADQDKDLLGYEAFFDNYVNKGLNLNYNIICIDFDRMWDNLNEMLFHLDLAPQYANTFPDKKKTQKEYDPKIVQKLNKINDALIKKIQKMPPIKVIYKNHSSAALDIKKK